MSHTISPGTRLGPYEIHSLLGAGGMGEVYRARDSRLQRDVAIKVLSRALAGDKDRLSRFEREARAAGQLNHPNIMAVHDIGSTAADGATPKDNGLPYIVCELLEGVTLRTKLADGPIPAKKAIAIASQIARGLAAAHAKGIAHRDLKPENLMILAGDHVKILDFGLAKLLRPDPDGAAPKDDTGSIARSLTMTGEILGTPSYMSPEQVRDQPSDHRTDIFALGAILYEMLTGKRAFDGPSHADRMTSILTKEPPPLPTGTEDQAPGITAIIAHCLEKSPSDRFDSANDLAFALSLVTGRATQRPTSTTTDAAPPSSKDFIARDLKSHRVTLREGAVRGARYTPDGNAICYGAVWEGKPVELFWTYPTHPEARTMGAPQTDLLAIAPSGEMAVSVRNKSRGGFHFTGMLARMPAGGGAPREIMDNVWEADFHPDGRRLAILREEGGLARIEFPAGNALYQTAGWISSMRFSPDGSRVAFLDHVARGADSGYAAVVDMDRVMKKLSPVWSSSRGLAWSPDGREVVYAASNVGSRTLHASNLEGVTRTVLGVPANLTLKDVSRQGEALIAVETERMRSRFIGAEGDERDLTWLDWTLVRSITKDGSRILFDETGAGGGELGAVYTRGTDGSPAVRLGDGTAFSLSPDGNWALTNVGVAKGRVELIPCGAGEPRTIPTGDLEVDQASWFPDGRSLCFLGSEGGRARRLYKVDLESGKREPFSEEGITYYDSLVSPDGRFALAHAPGRKLTVYPVDGSPSRPLAGAEDYERPVGWSAEGDAVYVYSRGELPAKVWRIDLKTGARALHREISPADRTGVEGIASARMTPDGRILVYSYYQRLSWLYSVEGLF